MLVEFDPQGDVGNEQSPRPVAPTIESAPVVGFTELRSPSKPSESRDPPGPGTRPPVPTEMPGPMGVKDPVERSTVPNCPPSPMT